MRSFLINLLTIIICVSVKAQTVDFELSLSSNNVSDIAQQDNGLVWVATDEGLNVFYDNENYVFYSNIQDSLSVLNSKINSLKVTSDDNLITLSQDGLSVFNSEEFNFIQIRLGSKPISIVEDVIDNKYWHIDIRRYTYVCL
jgi:ligand-binding sensor domain-containing protein